MTTQQSKEQAYTISKVFGFIKVNKPNIASNDMLFWDISETKMLRKFELVNKIYIQIISKDEENAYLSFCQEGNSVRFFKNDLSIEQIDRLL